MKNSLGKNAIYKVILNLFNLLVPLFVGPYIAGLLSPELYGVYNRVYAEFQVFFIVGAFGIYNYGVREISKARHDEKRRTELFTSLFVIGVISNLLVTIVYVIYFMSRSTGIDQYVYLVMIIQMISNIFYIEFVNEAVENYRFITLKTILIRILYFAAIFIFVRKPTDVIAYSVVVSMTVLMNNLVSYAYLKKDLRFDFKHIKILQHLFPLFVTFALANVELLYSQLDKIMLGAYVDDIAVTEYTLPTTLMGMLGTIPLSLITVTIPRLAKYIGEDNKKDYEQTLHTATRTYMAILAPMAFGVLVLSQEIMWLYTKDVYTYVFPVLALAALARIVYGYESIVTHLVMYVNGLEKQLTLFLFGFGLLNGVLNIGAVMLGKFTAASALLTTVFASAVFVIAATKYSQQKLNIRCDFFSKDILQYFAVSFLFIPIAFVIHQFQLGYIWNIVLDMILCVGVYGIYMLWKKDPLVEIILGKLRRNR